MTDWIQAVDEPKALAFLEALYELRRPTSERDANDGTTHFGVHVIHPGFAPNEARAGLIRIRMEEVHRIHANASKNALDHIIQPYVDSGDVTPGELLSIQNAIEAAKGGTVDMHDALPGYFTATMIDDATMTSEGWFDTE